MHDGRFFRIKNRSGEFWSDGAWSNSKSEVWTEPSDVTEALKAIGSLKGVKVVFGEVQHWDSTDITEFLDS